MKNILQTIKFAAFGIVLALGASYVYAQSWTPAPANPPASNTYTPIYVHITDQIKSGGLAVNAFTANQNAQFDTTVYLQGAMHGGTYLDTISTVNFGGVDPINAAITRIVNIIATGGLKATETIQSDTLADAGLTVANLCANSAGELIRCTGSTNTTSYPTITQVEVYTGPSGSPVPIECIVDIAGAVGFSSTYTIDFTFDSSDIPDRDIDVSVFVGSCTVTIPAGHVSNGVWFTNSSSLHQYPSGRFGLTANATANDYCVSSTSIPITQGYECQ